MTATSSAAKSAASQRAREGNISIRSVMSCAAMPDNYGKIMARVRQFMSQFIRLAPRACRVIKSCPPIRVGTVGRVHATFIRCTILPPDRAALSQTALGGIDRGARGALFGLVCGLSHRPPRLHERLYRGPPFARVKAWIGPAPKAGTRYEIPPVRRFGIILAPRHAARSAFCVRHIAA